MTGDRARRGRRTLRGPLVVVALAAAFAGSIAPATLAAESRLAFRNARPLSLSWEQARTGRAVRLCNVSDRQVTDVDVDATGFAFVHGRTSLADADVVQLDVRPGDGTLAPGACATITLRAADVSVDPDSYEGRLAATGSGAGIARLAVTIAVAREEPAVAAELEAPSDPITLAATRDRPIDGQVTLNGELALVVARAGALGIPRDGEPIGNVFGHGEVGVLRVTGPADEESKPGAVLVPIRLDGISKIGDFTGTIRLGSGDRAAFRVKVTSTDAWPWAVLAIVLGAGLGLLPQYVMRRRRPKSGLYDELNALPGAYRVASSYWTEHRAVHPQLPDLRISQEGLEPFTTDTGVAIRTYAKGTFFFDTASEDFRALRKPLAEAAADAACLRSATETKRLRDESGLAGALLALEREKRAVVAYLRAAFPAKCLPLLLVKADGPFEPAPPKTVTLEVGEATARAATARELTALLKRWLGLAREVCRYELWALLLDRLAAIPEQAGGLSERDAARLRKAHARVVEAHEELLDAEDAADLERVGAERDLREAYAMLARLGGRYRLWVGPELAAARPAAEIVNAVTDRTDVDVPGALRAYKAALWLPTDPATAPSSIFGAASFVLEPLGTLRMLAGSRVLWDATVFGLALLVGIVAGLVAFYFGKTFGTWEDYLTVILVGTGSQVLLKGLTDTLTGIWAPPLPRVGQASRPASGSVALADRPA